MTWAKLALVLAILAWMFTRRRYRHRQKLHNRIHRRPLRTRSGRGRTRRHWFGGKARATGIHFTRVRRAHRHR